MLATGCTLDASAANFLRRLALNYDVEAVVNVLQREML